MNTKQLKSFSGRAILMSIMFACGFLISITNVMSAKLQPLQKHRDSTKIIVDLIGKNHYRKKPLNNDLSATIFKRFLENMDPNRNIFHAKDVRSFEQYRWKLDDYLKKADLSPAYEMYNLFRKRVDERAAYALSLLNQPFKFNVDESYQFDRSEAPWAKNKANLDKLWYKRVKNDYLSLKLSGKKSDKEIRKTLRKRYERLARRNQQSKSEDVYQLFINAYTLSIEPHTSYFSPRTSEDFKIHMSLSLEGIGAALGIDNEHTVIRRIIPGGPADLSGKLYKTDKIVAVGQGKSGKLIDVVGWRLDDVVRKIRGPKGTVLRLQILPKGLIGSPIKTITLVRNKIKLQDQAAKQTIIKIGKGKRQRKIGVITIPTFYLDFDAQFRGDSDYRSTTRDVLAIIKNLKRKKVDGILIDLRSNGGGSLREATTLTGLFIRTGPVVQIRNYMGAIEMQRDNDPVEAYTGPLAVLVDRGSASASEIFAGAIQDYKRGIIIGESTFGKGTVQTLIDLNRYRYRNLRQRSVDKSSLKVLLGKNKNANKLGQLKLTIAQFFRVNGESTQHRGIVPDVKLPSMFGVDDQGESSFKNALPWDKISPTRYYKNRMALSSLKSIRSQHVKRLKSDVGFKYFNMLANIFKNTKDQKSVSLLESKRKKERESRESKRLLSENKMRASLGMKAIKKNHKRDDDEEEVTAKILLNEAVIILADFINVDKQAQAIVKAQ